jgi:hypothetical protein
MSAISDVRKSPGDVLYATDTGSASKDLVAAVTGKKIKVLSAIISQASGTSVKFRSDTTSDITAALTTTASDLNIILPYNPSGWFQTVAGEKLNFVPATSVVTNVAITYILI